MCRDYCRKNDLLEIQLQMEFVETEQRQLEGRGVSIERKLRGEEGKSSQVVYNFMVLEACFVSY